MDRGLAYVSTPNAPQSRAPLSQAVVNDGLVFTAGLVGIEPESGELADGVEAQTRQTLLNLAAVLDAAGSGIERTIKVTVFVRDMATLPRVDAVYAVFFPAPWPARSVLQAGMAREDLLIEIEAIAKIGGR